MLDLQRILQSFYLAEQMEMEYEKYISTKELIPIFEELLYLRSVVDHTYSEENFHSLHTMMLSYVDTGDRT